MYDVCIFDFLIVYLLLTLGASHMERIGLDDCIARKKNKNNVKSLAAISNRDMNAWEFSHIKLDEEKKKRLIAAALQVMVLL